MTEEPTYSADEIRRGVVDRIREVEFNDTDPVAAELIADVSVADGLVTIVVAFEGLDLEAAERLAEQVRGAGLATPGVEHVRLESTRADAPNVGVPVTGVDTMLAVGSAKGGVGKTTITVALARALDERGLDVGIFDANVHAADAPDMLGAEGPIHSTPAGRPEPIDADGIQIVSVELIANDGPVAWRGAMVHDVVTDLLGNAVWDDRDIVLIDLPPGIGDAVYRLVQQAPLDGSILVTTPTATSVDGTERTMALCEANDVPTAAVVANMTDGPDHGSPFAARDGTPIELVDDEPFVEVPFEPALQTLETCGFADPETPGEAAVADLAATVETYYDEVGGPAAPEDAIDLRGLPPTTTEQQALTELGVTPDDGCSFVTRSNPDELVDVLETALAKDGTTIDEHTVEDLGRDGWLVTITCLAAESAEPAV